MLAFHTRQARTSDRRSPGNAMKLWGWFALAVLAASSCPPRGGLASAAPPAERPPGLARTPPLDQTAFRQCLTGREALAALKAADAEQRRRGIAMQPVFEIGARRIFGVQPVEAMVQAIELELPD